MALFDRYLRHRFTTQRQRRIGAILCPKIVSHEGTVPSKVEERWTSLRLLNPRVLNFEGNFRNTDIFSETLFSSALLLTSTLFHRNAPLLLPPLLSTILSCFFSNAVTFTCFLFLSCNVVGVFIVAFVVAFVVDDAAFVVTHFNIFLFGYVVFSFVTDVPLRLTLMAFMAMRTWLNWMSNHRTISTVLCCKLCCLSSNKLCPCIWTGRPLVYIYIDIHTYVYVCMYVCICKCTYNIFTSVFTFTLPFIHFSHTAQIFYIFLFTGNLDYLGPFFLSVVGDSPGKLFRIIFSI